MSLYKLMHKNDPFGIISIKETSGDIENVMIKEPELAPFLGNADEEKMRSWWKFRAVPASRKTMRDVIRKAGCTTTEDYLVKNLALSLTDCYWICPVDMTLSWNDVKLWNFVNKGYSEVPYHNATTYDPNATLGGQMEKYWVLSGEKPELIKSCSSYQGYQAVNEIFATEVNKRQANDIPYVKYIMTKEDQETIVRCKSFTSEDVELIPAYEVLNSKKRSNDRSEYEHYIDVCTAHSIKEEIIRGFMDYQTVTDFIISNTDRHFMNFGILRNTNTLKIIGPAPIYDNGNSMFYRDTKKYDRASILERDITAFYKREEKMLEKVTDRNIVDLNKLPNPNEVINIYLKAGISPDKCGIIASNYSVKLELAKDFQKGYVISNYEEKQKTPTKSQNKYNNK